MTVFKGMKKFPGVQYYESQSRRWNGKPDRCFYIRYRNMLGKLVREKIGWESQGVTAAYAYAIRNERIRNINLGQEPIPINKRKKLDISYSDYVEQKFLPWSRDNKKLSTYLEEERIYRVWLKPHIGCKSLKDINPFDIEKIKQKMKSEGRSPRRIEYMLAVLRHSLNMAIKWGIFAGENPVAKVAKPKKDNRRLRFLNQEEAIKLLEACKARSRQLYEICLLSLNTGMRASEIFNLKWGDVDLENGLIRIRDGKNNMSRTVYVNETVKLMFLGKQQGEPEELVFRSRTGGKIKEVSRAFNRILKDLGFNKGVTDVRDKVVFHTLRHTFASWLALSGVPLLTIKELLGHKTLAMTERYSHLIPDVKKEAVEKITVFGNHASTNLMLLE